MVYSTGSPDTTGISLGVLACFPVGYKTDGGLHLISRVKSRMQRAALI